MKTNEFSNVLKSMKTMFPDDNRPVEVFIQEYYPALKGFDFQVVVAFRLVDCLLQNQAEKLNVK